MPGQFATDGSGGGKGNQRIFTKATFTVNWSASSDFERPDISTVSATLTGTTASFRVCSPATDVNRGVLLFLPTGGPNPQAWTHVELVKSTLGCWVGTATVAAGVTTIGQFNTMLCDVAGNCGASTNKARNYTASPSTQLFVACRRSGAGVQRPVPRSDDGDDHGTRRDDVHGQRGRPAAHLVHRHVLRDGHG